VAAGAAEAVTEALAAHGETVTALGVIEPREGEAVVYDGHLRPGAG
jgi:acetyl-CoA acetyltransferase